MSSSPELIRLHDWQKKALVAGVCLMGLGAGLGLMSQPNRFFCSYLEGYLICLGFTLGSLGIWMLHNLVGGQWGDPIGSIVRASARMLPLVALGFIPLALGAKLIYPWMNSTFMHSDPELMAKVWYLNSPFFFGRAIAFFLTWMAIVWGVRRLSGPQSAIAGSDAKRKLQNFSGFGLVLYGGSISFAAFDWVMSLSPSYYSSIYGVLVLVGQLQGAFAFVTLMAILFHATTLVPESATQKWNDLGNLLLMCVMLWAYMSFSQLLITWSGQLPQEIVWYNVRFNGGWQYVGLVLLFINFALPFLLLLFRKIKKDTRALLKVCVILLVMRWIDEIWLVLPNATPHGFALNWLDIVVPLGLVALWFAGFLYFWKSTPSLPRGHDAQTAHYDV